MHTERPSFDLCWGDDVTRLSAVHSEQRLLCDQLRLWLFFDVFVSQTSTPASFLVTASALTSCFCQIVWKVFAKAQKKWEKKNAWRKVSLFSGSGPPVVTCWDELEMVLTACALLLCGCWRMNGWFCLTPHLQSREEKTKRGYRWSRIRQGCGEDRPSSASECCWRWFRAALARCSSRGHPHTHTHITCPQTEICWCMFVLEGSMFICSQQIVEWEQRKRRWRDRTGPAELPAPTVWWRLQASGQTLTSPAWLPASWQDWLM